MDASPATEGFPTKIDASQTATLLRNTRNIDLAKARRTFLRHLAQTGNVTSARTSAGLAHKTIYQWKDRSPRFRDAWQRALGEARRRKVDRAEARLAELAIDGWQEPVYQGGQLVGHKPKVSVQALGLLLQAESKRKYAKRTESRSTNTSVLVSVDARQAFLADPAYAQAICAADAILAAPRAISGPASTVVLPSDASPTP